MHRSLAALFLATTLALTGCNGGSMINGPAPASFLYTAAVPLSTNSFVNSYPVGSTGTSVAAASSVNLGSSTFPFALGVRGDAAGRLYTFTDIGSSYTVNVYTTTGGVLTLTRSFSFTAFGGIPAYFAVDPTGIVYVSTAVFSPTTFLFVPVLLKFAANATGTPTPTIITVSTAFNPMATDSAGNLYGYDFNGNVDEYLAGFTSGTPSKIITLTGIGTVMDMAIDSSNNLYFVSDLGRPCGACCGTCGIPVIVEYPSTNGTVTALRIINGPATLLVNPVTIAVDAAGNIYEEDGPFVPNVARSYSINVFPASAAGNAAPTSHFTMAATTISGFGYGPSGTDNAFLGLVAY